MNKTKNWTVMSYHNIHVKFMIQGWCLIIVINSFDTDQAL